MKFTRWLNSVLDKGMSKELFDHIRNFLICAFLLAIGTSELKHHESQFFGLVPGEYSGIGVIVFSLILIALNLYDGIRKLSNLKHHLLATIGLVMLYVFLSIRVVEMAWNYRIV
jgi:hypothetical protein